MMVSRQHRMLLSGPGAELLFGETAMLARATHLPGIVSRIVPEVTNVHVLFDQHEILRANDCRTESLQPGDRTVGGMDQATREFCSRSSQTWRGRGQMTMRPRGLL